MEILDIFSISSLTKNEVIYLCLNVLYFPHVVSAVFFESYINSKKSDNHIPKCRHYTFPHHSKEKYYTLCILFDFLKLNE